MLIPTPVIGGYLCSAILIIEAVLQKYYLGSTNEAGINAAVAFYFLFILAYGSTVDCAAYVYISEIWPTHLRSAGNTIGLVTFFSFSIAYTSPASLAIKEIGWRYYFVMASVCIVSATVMIFVCPEVSHSWMMRIHPLSNLGTLLTNPIIDRKALFGRDQCQIWRPGRA